MEKKNKLYLIIIIICTVLVIGICSLAIYQKSKHDKKISDGLKFKMEYEAYNDKALSDGTIYLKLDIPEDNPMVYKTPKQILDILHNDTALVYFGYPACPFARDTVEILLDVALKEKVKTIYYVDITNIRDEYEANGTLFPTQTQKGVDAYQDILKFFGSYLDDYYVGNDSYEYATGVKRLGAPTVVLVSGGEIKDLYTASVDYEKNFITGLNDEQKEAFRNKYSQMINKLQDKEDVVCSPTGC